MALNKVTYIDGSTVITAANLNDIQDEIIQNASDISGKQATLSFDATPTNGSSNPVTSDGIYDALATKQDTLTFDDTPTENSTNPVKSGGVYSAVGSLSSRIANNTSQISDVLDVSESPQKTTVNVSSIPTVSYWLKEIPPTTASSGSARSAKYNLVEYRGGLVNIKVKVIANAATDPKYSWAIVDNSNNILLSSPKNSSAQDVDTTVIIPDNAYYLWIGTDSTNIATAQFILQKTKLREHIEEQSTSLNYTFTLSNLTNKYWLTQIPPVSSASSNAAASYSFDISDYVGDELHIKSTVIATGTSVLKYAWAIVDENDNILASSEKTYRAQNVDDIINIPENSSTLWIGLDTTNYSTATVYILLPTAAVLQDEITALQKISGVSQYPIICWGDSLTSGAGWVGTPAGYPVVLAEEFGVECKNCGVGGETSSTIAARMGAIPAFVPAGGVNGTYSLGAFTDQWGNAVNPLLQDPLDTKGTVNPVTINGYSATLSINSNLDTYTISGYTGEASAIPLEMKFNGCGLTGLITIICVGQNDTADLDERIARIDSMIAHCLKDYLILGRPTGSEASMASEEETLLNKYGGRFLNSRELVSQYGMTVMELTPTAADTTAISSGAIPPSLLYDTVHLNENGYRAWGKFIAKRIRSLGFNKLFE